MCTKDSTSLDILVIEFSMKVSYKNQNTRKCGEILEGVGLNAYGFVVNPLSSIKVLNIEEVSPRQLESEFV